jgi:hypothetical protein
VAFTKVLISNISNLNSPTPPLSLMPPPPIPGSFNGYHFYIYIHVCTVFAPYSPSYTLSLPPPTGVAPPPPHRTSSALLLRICSTFWGFLFPTESVIQLCLHATVLSWAWGLSFVLWNDCDSPEGAPFN